jgi:hypothetical protein
VTKTYEYDEGRKARENFEAGMKALSQPRWSPQNRPYVVTSKPAIEIDPRQGCFYPFHAVKASWQVDSDEGCDSALHADGEAEAGNAGEQPAEE